LKKEVTPLFPKKKQVEKKYVNRPNFSNRVGFCGGNRGPQEKGAFSINLKKGGKKKHRKKRYWHKP